MHVYNAQYMYMHNTYTRTQFKQNLYGNGAYDITSVPIRKEPKFRFSDFTASRHEALTSGASVICIIGERERERGREIGYVDECMQKTYTRKNTHMDTICQCVCVGVCT